MWLFDQDFLIIKPMPENIDKITELYTFATNNWITINEITVSEESDHKKNRIGVNFMNEWHEVSLNNLQAPEQQIIFGIKVNTIKTF